VKFSAVPGHKRWRILSILNEKKKSMCGRTSQEQEESNHVLSSPGMKGGGTVEISALLSKGKMKEGEGAHSPTVWGLGCCCNEILWTRVGGGGEQHVKLTGKGRGETVLAQQQKVRGEARSWVGVKSYLLEGTELSRTPRNKSFSIRRLKVLFFFPRKRERVDGMSGREKL